MLKIYVRWNANGEGYDRVELILDQEVIQSYNTHNNRDRLYGYCKGVVATMRRMGFDIQMPQCLVNRHLTADTNCED